MKIQGYSDYEIYPNEGKIWSYKSNRWVGNKHKDGYWRCALAADNGAVWGTTIHRVVWTAVNGPIPQGMQVNHIDEDKNNNSISNLNLMTCKENINYGTHNERMAKALSKALTNRTDLSKQVAAYKDGQLIMIFPSIQEAERNGYSSGNICQCCNGLRQSHKGFQWRYL